MRKLDELESAIVLNKCELTVSLSRDVASIAEYFQHLLLLIPILLAYLT